ncbi:SPL family radical SAM protein [Chitinophaga qingshengii]|uniref:Radical SAM protein n=1 Tax=Chitinophaga qingshengii TaxID=1569794 RepID=A0ABR7TRD4_9BACT|nr:radical SAM protein [Chitinophaga qingshengii]MBC9933046.1 radical SAM protein [Chitinophaga qingshengii]
MTRSIVVTSVLNKTKRRDPWFLDDYTVNPYSGCSFNCLYCYIRGSKYGINMEEKLSVKSNAVELLERQLSARARKKEYGIIVLSSATDPYLQIEKTQRLTRRLLEVILRYRFPVHIITKSNLVSRDFDLLQEINQAAILPDDLRDKLAHKAFLTFSFSTTTDSIAHIFEPGATPPSQRLETLRLAVKSGLHSGVSLMPLLPFITDTGAHLDVMFSTFKAAGAAYIFPATLTLFGAAPADSKTLVLNAVAKHYPDLLEKYHRFFVTGSQMPLYYRQAFTRKMEELCRYYQLPDSLA